MSLPRYVDAASQQASTTLTVFLDNTLHTVDGIIASRGGQHDYTFTTTADFSGSLTVKTQVSTGPCEQQ